MPDSKTATVTIQLEDGRVVHEWLTEAQAAIVTRAIELVLGHEVYATKEDT